MSVENGAILGRLDEAISRMRDLTRLEEIKDNQAKQDSVDNKYRNLVERVSSFMAVLSYTKKYLEFRLSDECRDRITELLTGLQMVVRRGYADEERVQTAENAFKELQKNVHSEWQKHYSAYAIDTIHTLEVIRDVDPNAAVDCISKIRNAERWVVDEKVFKEMKSAMGRSNEIIRRLNLDDEVTAFLKSMTSGQATVSNLNSKIMAWINQRGLQNRIRLSFK